MATFYKGAGVGTHWHVNDSRRIGFSARSPQTASTTDALFSILQQALRTVLIFC